uniref:Tudor domain-containing protein n=1 Tax=Angiostrongylus cantonensis TaxID=6313 RepID=A0A0K0CW10_ANGCA
MGREKDVSTRLIRPTIPEFDTARLLLFVERWNPSWEHDASIKIFDEGIAQYMLVDIESHYKYMAALILSKPSLRCRIVDHEPEDFLDSEDNIITLVRSPG